MRQLQKVHRQCSHSHSPSESLVPDTAGFEELGRSPLRNGFGCGILGRSARPWLTCPSVTIWASIGVWIEGIICSGWVMGIMLGALGSGFEAAS